MLTPLSLGLHTGGPDVTTESPCADHTCICDDDNCHQCYFCPGSADAAADAAAQAAADWNLAAPAQKPAKGMPAKPEASDDAWEEAQEWYAQYAQGQDEADEGCMGWCATGYKVNPANVCDNKGWAVEACAGCDFCQ